MQSYEVEIKSLLGSSRRADQVRDAMRKLDPACKLESRNKQLNHYFVGGNLSDLSRRVESHFTGEALQRLQNLAEIATEFSVRSREKDDAVFLVIKASAGDGTSANGVARMEFEEKVPLSLAELDALIISAGFTYQAKWSREREEYVCLGINVTLDKNAGYGWLAEFERIVDDPSKVDAAREEIRALMAQIGVDELPQDRLARMFDFYNTNWRKYYGTENIFVIE